MSPVGAKPAEDIEVGDVIDGMTGPVRVTSRSLRARSGMPALVLLEGENWEQFRFEPGFDVPFYRPET